MNKGHEHGSHHHPEHAEHHHRRRGMHKDWRLWGVVALMLLAMLIYFTTSDESITPAGNAASQSAPAMPAAPAAP